MIEKTWNKAFLTNDNIAFLIKDLGELIRPNKDKYKMIVGIPRGGMIIAVWLSHQLNIQLIDGFNSLYDWYCDIHNPERILIVDDIVDTGKTLQELKDNGIICDTAALHYKPRSIIKPTYFSKEVENDLWVSYPWERDDEVPNREV